MTDPPIAVRVRFHAALQPRTEEGRIKETILSLPRASTLGDLLERVSLAYNPEVLLLVHNGELASPGQALAEGDQVHLIPAISGGSPVEGPNSPDDGPPASDGTQAPGPDLSPEGLSR